MTGGFRREAWLIAGLLTVYLALAAVLPAADDEIYYWTWARPLQFSYYDHPPLTAYLIRLSTDLLGDTFIGFRVPACLSAAFVMAVIIHLSRPRSLIPAIVFTPLFTVGAVLITPDAPLLFAWAAYVWWLVEVHRRLTPTADETADLSLSHSFSHSLRSGWRKPSGSSISDATPADSSSFGRQPTTPHANPTESAPAPASRAIPWWLWLLGGVILGSGGLGKYTMALAVPAGFVSFCMVGRLWRRWLPGYIAHGVVSFVVASPILIHNIQYNFTPLLFQWRHSMSASEPGLRPFGEFIGVQLLLFGTLPFFLYPWVLWRFRRLCENPRLRVCACLYAVPMTFFLYKATQARLQGNWALVMFVSFWPLAAVWYESVSKSRFWRWSTASAFIIPAAAVLFFVVHFIVPLPVVPKEGDRLNRQYVMNVVTREIAQTIHRRGEPLPVFTPTYQVTAWLRYQSLDGRQIDQIGRPSHFTQHPDHLMDVDRAYVVSEYLLPREFAEGFDPPEVVGDFPVVIRGEEVCHFQLLLYTKTHAAHRNRARSPVKLVNHEEQSQPNSLPRP